MWRNLSVPRSRDSRGFRYPLIVQMLKKDLPKTCITLFIDWESSLQFLTSFMKAPSSTFENEAISSGLDAGVPKK